MIAEIIQRERNLKQPIGSWYVRTHRRVQGTLVYKVNRDRQDRELGSEHNIVRYKIIVCPVCFKGENIYIYEDSYPHSYHCKACDQNFAGEGYGITICQDWSLFIADAIYHTEGWILNRNPIFDFDNFWYELSSLLSRVGVHPIKREVL